VPSMTCSRVARNLSWGALLRSNGRNSTPMADSRGEFLREGQPVPLHQLGSEGNAGDAGDRSPIFCLGDINGDIPQYYIPSDIADQY